MSADDKESSMLRGLEAGAAFYIVKPISYDDLKNLWQYTVTPKKGKSHVVIQEITSAEGEKTSDNEVESLINEEKKNKRDSKKKTWKKGNESNGKEKGETAAPKKAKVIWTAALHNRFLEAARKIGLESKQALSNSTFLYPSIETSYIHNVICFCPSIEQVISITLDVFPLYSMYNVTSKIG